MVKLHIKKGDESQFLFETTVQENIGDLIAKLTRIFNGRLKVDRLFYELETLAKHGITLPPNMQGLTDEQIDELHLEDKWSLSCIPQGGDVKFCIDPVGRRNGKAPSDKMADLLNRTRSESRAQVSKDLVKADKCLTDANIKEAIDNMRGSVMIVYPMGLPPHDPIKMEFEDEEDLTGTQASKDVLDEQNTAIWWASKEMTADRQLKDYIGKNEKTKIIVKLQKKGNGAPQREPALNEEEQKKMMAYSYKRQEDLKKLETEDSDAYLNSAWSDPNQLKRQFQGLNNVSWRPR